MKRFSPRLFALGFGIGAIGVSAVLAASVVTEKSDDDERRRTPDLRHGLAMARETLDSPWIYSERTVGVLAFILFHWTCAAVAERLRVVFAR
jgi:hypothetical protein